MVFASTSLSGGRRFIVAYELEFSNGLTEGLENFVLAISVFCTTLANEALSIMLLEVLEDCILLSTARIVDVSLFTELSRRGTDATEASNLRVAAILPCNNAP